MAGVLKQVTALTLTSGREERKKRLQVAGGFILSDRRSKKKLFNSNLNWTLFTTGHSKKKIKTTTPPPPLAEVSCMQNPP